MKFKMTLIALIVLLSTNSMAWVDVKTQQFLDKLNSSANKPIEQLTPSQARNVLINAQNSLFPALQ